MKRVLILGGCGYVGGALAPYLKEQGFWVDSVDLHSQVDSGAPSRFPADYRDLTADDLAYYQVIVHLAAHSSVQKATRDPRGAIMNNLLGFYDLLAKLRSQLLIYAGTSAVYSGAQVWPASEASEQFSVRNMYDLTKLAADGLAKLSGKACYGLRLGTVNGPAPIMRWDLMINKMVRDGLRDGAIVLRSPGASRPILGMDDLCRSVAAVIDGPAAPGIYNLASFNATVQEIGRAVSTILGVDLQIRSGTPTYDFRIDTALFRSRYRFHFDATVESIVAGLLSRAAAAAEPARAAAVPVMRGVGVAGC